jgi:hypothetical protein
VKFAEQVEYGVQLTINNVLEWISGEDLIEESMVRWISERFLGAGIHDYNYRWLHYGSSDSYVSIAMNSFNFLNHFGDEMEAVIQGNYDIDFPSFDVLSSPLWKDFIIQYKSCTSQLAKNLELFVKSIATNVASNTNLPEIELKLDPTDSENYLDELNTLVQLSIDPNADWFEEALTKSDQGFTIKDPLGQALVEFTAKEWRELFQLNSSVDRVESDLARSMVEEAISTSSFESDSGMINEIGEVKDAIRSDSSWGVDASIRSIFEEDVRPRLALFEQVFGNIPWEGQSTTLQKVIMSLAGDAIDYIPGIKRIVVNQTERQISEGSSASSCGQDSHSIIRLGWILVRDREWIDQLRIA